MTVRLVRSDRLYPGVPYAYASIAPRGSLIFTAGACPLDDKGEVAGAADVRAQASTAMANLGTALQAAGAGLADVLKTTVFVASAERADLVAAWEVVSAAFGDHDAPSTLLGVTVLGYPGQLVEIEAVAAVPALLPRCRCCPAARRLRQRRGRHRRSEPGPAGVRVACDDLSMLGTVARLRRYPVKSMLGEDVDASHVTFTGLACDRRLAVISRRTGKVASAKYPRLWRDLLTLSAAAPDEGTLDNAANQAVRITLPDGKTIQSTDAGVDEVLSALLDEPVTLAATPPPEASLDRAIPEAVLRDGVDAQVPAEIIEIGAGAPPGTFVDFAPVHLLTTSTLDRIAELSPHGQADLERYRPNVVVRTAVPGFTENDWLERTLRIGGELIIRVIARTSRCAVPTLVHGALPRDADALRVLAGHNRLAPLEGLDPEPCAGVYAEVLNPGRIRTGDTVRLA